MQRLSARPGGAPGASGSVTGGPASAFVHLLFAWARRDFRVRYSQTLLGSAWGVGQPIAITAALVFLLSRTGAPPIPGIPYASFVFPGMVCWILFANGVTGSVMAVAQSMPIVAKVKFPRLVAPLSGALLPLIDFGLAAVFLPVLLLVQDSGTAPDLGLLAVAVVGTLFMGMGMGCFVGALSVFVRDLRQALPFALQLALLASPIAYPADRLPDALAWNPMTTFITAFRSGVIDTPPPAGHELLRAFLLSLVILMLGILYFRGVEERFADVA